ncbi:MAG: metallophosphoesterase family protein [Halobacteriales archaeon]
MRGTRPFDPPADAPHRWIDRDRWDDVYIVGDVHGCLTAVRQLLDRLRPTGGDLVVFVGDLVRKGPDSKGVLDLVRERENFVSVRGNNEEKLLDGSERLPSLTAEDLAFVESMPVTIGWEGTLVVHGGVNPRQPLAAHTPRDLLTMRSLAPGGGYERPFWFEEYRGSPRVFFGHTVLSEPFVTGGAVGLDTGCVHGGQLTAFDVSADELVSVDATKTHLERSADSIVDPRVAPRSE